MLQGKDMKSYVLGTWYVCYIYDVPFQELLNAVEQTGDIIARGVDAILYDPPYNTQQIADYANSEHNQLVPEDTNILSDVT